MKVLRLEIEGFGPYLALQEIDFTAFDEDGLFVITGKTGAGKSTVLDAICYALYGTVPRYDGAEKSLRSDFCGEDDATEVALEFEVGADRYRVWRSPDYERAKKRGAGTTTKQAEAELSVWRGGTWAALEVKPREVGVRVLDIMQLNADQFLQVILLAQGRFSEFLQAKTPERLEVLRSLFGTQRFRDVEAHLRDMEREATRGVAAADAELVNLIGRAVDLLKSIAGAGVDAAAVDTPATDARVPWLDEQSEVLVQAADAARAERTKCAEAAVEAGKALADAEAVEDKRVQLTRARVTLAELEDRAEQAAAERAQLESARRAAPVMTPIATARVADDVLRKDREDLKSALEEAAASAHLPLAWPTGTLAESTLDALRERLVELASKRGGLDAALGLESQLPALEARVAEARGELIDLTDRRAALQAELDSAPAEREVLRTRLAGAIDATGLLANLTAEMAAARDSVDAHHCVAELTDNLAGLRDAEAAASTDRASTATEHDRLIQRRLHGEAARLATTLEPGSPCPVCGSDAHPHPAKPGDNAVTDEQVDAADTAAEAARTALVDATAKVKEAESSLAEARAKAVGDSRDAAADRFVDAERALTDTTALSGQREATQTQLDSFDQGLDRLRNEIADGSGPIEAAGAGVALAISGRESARATVTAARAEHDSVAERASALDASRDLLDSVVAARESVGRAESEADQALRALEIAVAEAGFTSAGDAKEAALPAAALDALAAVVAKYDAVLSGARAVVSEFGAEELPEADLVSMREASAGANAARDAAIEADTDARARAESFAALSRDYATAAGTTEDARARAMTVRRLSETLQGNEPNERRMRLESFVLAAKLEQIVAAANVRLVTMSAGQYRLEYDDGAQYRNTQAGLGLKVADAHTGRSRSTRSLSGGETFLASLALALGLAEAVTAEAGGISLSTLFIDEGFGSLDGDTLEVAMSTLDGLRAGGRTVGLISHVDAMKEAIPAKLEVFKRDDGSSHLRVATTVE